MNLDKIALGPLSASLVKNDEPVIHDFRNRMWGWSIMRVWPPNEDGTREMMGCGKGLKAGHKILIRSDQGTDCTFDIRRIEYKSNPSDLFVAVAFLSNAIGEARADSATSPHNPTL
jgi:hypothetical protein